MLYDVGCCCCYVTSTSTSLTLTYVDAQKMYKTAFQLTCRRRRSVNVVLRQAGEKISAHIFTFGKNEAVI
jgi:hypothetical protein